MNLTRNGPTRTLKNLLQESSMPPWERQRLPLLFRGDDLAWVPGVGVAAAFQCPPHEEGVTIDWIPGDTQTK